MISYNFQGCRLKRIVQILTVLCMLFFNLGTIYAGDYTLTWDAPTVNEDGSPLSDLAGYEIHYGTSSGSYSQVIDTASLETTYVVNNLNEGMTYYFAVTSYDLYRNNSDFSNELIKTIPAAIDTTPPSISGIDAQNITVSSASIYWMTDELSDTQIEYGTSTAYGNSTLLGTSPVTVHNQIIGDLSPSTSYHFRVMSRDQSGNLAVSEDYTFTTSDPADSTPPQISGLYENNLTTSTITIHWTTDEPSDTQIAYGMSTSYGYLTTLDSTNVTVHSQTISGLAPSTLYHFQLQSRDSTGNLATSQDYTFTTADVPDTTPPLISNVVVTGVTDASATITWATDEASSSQVEYGFDSTYGSSTTTDPTLKTLHVVQISGLSSSSTYNFRVTSVDSNNNSANSPDFTFSTSNLPPHISGFTADNLDVIAPQIVNFSATASDSDGIIASYEWDFDGDGIYDEDSGTAPEASYYYTQASIYNSRLRVTDNGGASTSSNILQIKVSNSNVPPIIRNVTITKLEGVSFSSISLKAAQLEGVIPLSVAFDVDAIDEDGTISSYQFDFDGNGTYDAETTTNPTSHTYNDPGTFAATIKVTDDDGATSTAEIVIKVLNSLESEDEAEVSSGPGNVEKAGGDGGGCFIATAAYGSYLDPHVDVLRKFRDNYLLTNKIGKAFMNLYYNTSPPMADFIARHDSLKLATRLFLTPVVYGLSYIQYVGAVILPLLGIIIYLRLSGRKNRATQSKY